MYMDAELLNHMEASLNSVGKFFLGPILSMQCLQRVEEDEVIMDLGCGPGNLSTRSILSVFPKTKKIVAVDVQQNMIESAMSNNPYPSVEYSVASIEEWSTIAKWENKISKLFAIHVFHWLKDQKQSFENVFKLLKPGGIAVFFFVLNSTFFESCLELKRDPQWAEYLKDVDDFVPPSHKEMYEPEHYTDMLKEMGFSIEYCRSEVKEDAFTTDDMMKDFFASICVSMRHIPDELKDHFKYCIFDKLLEKNGRVNEQVVHRGRMIELIVKKI